MSGLTVCESPFKLEWMEDPWSDVARAGDWLLGLEEAIQPDVVHLNSYVHGALSWHSPIRGRRTLLCLVVVGGRQGGGRTAIVGALPLLGGSWPPRRRSGTGANTGHAFRTRSALWPFEAEPRGAEWAGLGPLSSGRQATSSF